VNTNDIIINQFIANLNSGTTKKYYVSQIKLFLNYIGNKDIGSIVFDDLVTFKAMLAISRHKISSQRTKLNVIKSFMTFCYRMKYLGTNPAEFLALPKQQEEEPAVLSMNEAKELLRVVEQWKMLKPEAKTRDWVMVNILLGCGLRVSEIVNLKIKDFTTQQGVDVLYVLGKGNKERVLKVQSELAKMIREYIAEFRKEPSYKSSIVDEHIFLTQYKKPMNSQAVQRMVSHYLDLANLKKRKKKRLSVHTLRHTCFTLELTHGANLMEIKEQAGHSSLITTQRYLHITDKLKHSATDKNPLFAPEGMYLGYDGKLRSNEYKEKDREKDKESGRKHNDRERVSDRETAPNNS